MAGSHREQKMGREWERGGYLFLSLAVFRCDLLYGPLWGYSHASLHSIFPHYFSTIYHFLLFNQLLVGAPVIQDIYIFLILVNLI